MPKDSKEIVLTVQEARQDDIDRGIVRIENEFLKKLGLQQGDFIEIEGDKKTVAIAGRAYPADLGLGTIRMDPSIRKNAGTSISEKVTLRAIDIRPAKKITIAPYQKGMRIQAPPKMFLKALVGRPVSKGDIITPATHGRVRRIRGYDPLEDLSDILGAAMSGGLPLMSGLKFIVVTTSPKGAVLVTEETQLELKPEAVEITEDHVPDVSYEDIGGLKEEVDNGLKSVKSFLDKNRHYILREP